jgi:hypothetical protein
MTNQPEELTQTAASRKAAGGKIFSRNKKNNDKNQEN